MIMQEEQNELINEIRKQNVFSSIRGCDNLVLSKIEPLKNTDFYNKETKFPLMREITLYANKLNLIEGSEKKDCGWKYFDLTKIKKNENIDIEGKIYRVECSLFDLYKNKLILQDLETKKLVSIDLNDNNNIDNLYNILKDRKKLELELPKNQKPKTKI